jgi:hypothetical protein
MVEDTGPEERLPSREEIMLPSEVQRLHDILFGGFSWECDHPGGAAETGPCRRAVEALVVDERGAVRHAFCAEHLPRDTPAERVIRRRIHWGKEDQGG